MGFVVLGFQSTLHRNTDSQKDSRQKDTREKISTNFFQVLFQIIVIAFIPVAVVIFIDIIIAIGISLLSVIDDTPMKKNSHDSRD